MSPCCRVRRLVRELALQSRWRRQSVHTTDSNHGLPLADNRLNRGGDRTANNALWTITMVRMRSDPRTQAYVQRRTQEGLSHQEIQRCLKRYVVREIYPLLLADLSASTHAS